MNNDFLFLNEEEDKAGTSNQHSKIKNHQS